MLKYSSDKWQPAEIFNFLFGRLDLVERHFEDRHASGFLFGVRALLQQVVAPRNAVSPTRVTDTMFVLVVVSLH